MAALTNFFCFFLLHFVTAPSQINLDLTDWVSDSQQNVIFQHDCLHVAARIEKESDPYQIISYCMSEWSSQWNIHLNNLDQSFTFDELYKLNITIEQLYIWSASIDVMERYQLYVNQISTSKEFLSMGRQLFFNCTLPRFGTSCQYSLDIYETNNLSLNEIIYNYYQEEYNPMELTCYTHLKCNRGSDSTCLDSTEICDGYIDCQDAVDEKHCWQIEINECEDHEYRCDNGQCIPIAFFADDTNTFECLDQTDELHQSSSISKSYVSLKGEPTFAQEDVACARIPSYTSVVRLTSSCVLQRDKLLIQAMFFNKPSSLSDDCWLTFKCILNEEYVTNAICKNLSEDWNWKDIIKKNCPDMLVIPNESVAFGHIHFAYTKNYIINSNIFRIPEYICYNEQLCGGFHSHRTILSYNNMICRASNEFPITLDEYRMNPVTSAIKSLYIDLFRCNTIIYNDSVVCNSLMMYRCINSTKCIPKRRLCDGIIDCDYADDEQCSFIGDNCSKNEFIKLFKCTTVNMCIHLSKVRNGFCDCKLNEYGLCDDEITDMDYIRKHISFQTICDGFTELAPIIINGRNETDETECEQWQCNNTYTRCDGFWNCLNGADEVDCNTSSLLKCPIHHHICVSPETNQLMCLPLEKANDGNINCLGGTDEPKLCRGNNYQLNDANFYCMDDINTRCVNSKYFCFQSQCENKSDTQLCNKSRNILIYFSICEEKYVSIRSHVERFFCERPIDTQKSSIVYFSLDVVRNTMIKRISSTRYYEQTCHRGLGLNVWLNNKQNLSTRTCLCPPSFYGNRCQYQNQRVSLTLQFRTYSDSRQTLFTIVVLLIDDDDDKRIIHSYQQFSYLYIRHCKIKFNIYLLYSIRPKNETKHYSIHIDIYEKNSLTYRGSLLSILKFSFLPVHRIALQLNIPPIYDKIEKCIDHRCIHGQCIQYYNTKSNITFCQCQKGWSGKYCTISHKCTCSSDSLCIGILSNNRSLCICPMNKWGPQCLLRSMICQTCLNGGTCIPIDENVISEKKFLCICSKGFSGDRCEISDTNVILSFDKDIILPEYIIVHFIELISNAEHINGSTFKRIPINKNSVSIYWSRPFHITFVEFPSNDYYLIIIQKLFNRSRTIFQTINSSNHCKHISKVLHETIIKLNFIRRIKYYHLPCQNYSSNLSCFYDENYFCLCYNFGLQRLANCFEFNRSRKSDCFGESNCENGAQCLQDSHICPQTSICICPKCFYGTRCQFSSNLFGLSLDAILGYYIQPHTVITYQPSIIQTSVVLTILMTISGFANGIASLITFKNNEAYKTGCVFYLLATSIIVIFTIIIFALKFSILLIAQMTYITNQSFLYFQCYSIDFLLQIGLNIDRWLGACVAIERAISSIQGARFNKEKSKKMAKYIIFSLLFVIILTHIHDPIHRRLINDDDDNDQQRIWCIVTYSSHLQIYNSIINTFHFFVPFIVNLISPIIIIKMQIRQRLTVQPDQNYRQLLHEQCQRHSHLLIGSIVLVILATPRLIISFVSSCMKSSNRNSWLFLFGYFISFIPLTLHFIIFVLPSKLFKEEFQKRAKQYRRMLTRRLHRTV